jgi:hypothetical protein
LYRENGKSLGLSNTTMALLMLNSAVKLRSDLKKNSITTLNIPVSGSEERRSGPTAVSTKATGKMAQQLVRAASSMLMAMSTMDPGRMTKLMVMVSTLI